MDLLQPMERCETDVRKLGAGRGETVKPKARIILEQVRLIRWVLSCGVRMPEIERHLAGYVMDTLS